MAELSRIDERGLRQNIMEHDSLLQKARETVKTGFSAESAGSLDQHAALMKHDNMVLHQRGGEVGTFGTVVMVFRSFVGIGVLAMPYAMYKLGWLASSILLPLFGVMMLYCIDLLIRVANDLRFTGSK